MDRATNIHVDIYIYMDIDLDLYMDIFGLLLFGTEEAATVARWCKRQRR